MADKIDPWLDIFQAKNSVANVRPLSPGQYLVSSAPNHIGQTSELAALLIPC